MIIDMPVMENKPEFLREAWALYAIGTAILLTRFAVRFKTVGVRGLQGDDFFSFLVLLFYAGDAATVHLVYFLGTNVEASVLQKNGVFIPPNHVDQFMLGSKLQLVAWYTYTALLWSLKGTMLCFFARLTINTWHSMFVRIMSVACVLTYMAVLLTITFSCFPTQKNWQVVPDPGKTCTFKGQNLYVTTVLNVLTDAAMLCIPLPLLWKLQVPLRQKIVIGLLLSSGAFVIGAAVTRLALTLQGNPSALNINAWGVRETIVGIVTVNVPILRPMFNRSFWTPGLSPPGGSTNRTGGTAGSHMKSGAQISGAYELTTSSNGYKRNRADSEPDSDLLRLVSANNLSQTDSVMVRTTYEVSSEYDGRSGATGVTNKVSIRGGEV